MCNVLLFNTPFKNEKLFAEHSLPPLGLYYIATYLKEKSIDVQVFDCIYDNLLVDDILKIIDEVKPKYVGLNIFSQNLLVVKEIVESCETSTHFIIGGQVVKFIYHEVKSWVTENNIDLIIGDGEFITYAIVTSSMQEAPIYTSDNLSVYEVNKTSTYFPSNISELGLDRRMFAGREIINHYSLKEASIITSRGCIYNCAFCGGARSLNRDIPVRKIFREATTSEINDILKYTPDVKCIRVLDDLFLKSRGDILSAIQLFSSFNQLKWRAMVHICSFNSAIDLLDDVRESGCKELFVGIESGSNQVRRKINKEGNREQVIDMLTQILEHGIDVKGYFIYGFSDETLNEFEQTYTLARTLKDISRNTIGDFRIRVFEFRPYHGTQLYNEIIKKSGAIDAFSQNNNINIFSDRRQFNFHAGNYSKCSQDQIDEYIIKTIKLNGTK